MPATALTPALIVAVLVGLPAIGDTYRGVPVARESRCAPYDRGDYPYSQSVEQRIVASLGAVYGPYSGACFAHTGETDIEHIVATSEAHDSGLCAASAATKAAFASDLLNLTLASPSVNRHRKSGKDAAEWLPDLNACWFAARTLEFRRKYGLTIDRREAEAVEATLSRCASTEMVVVPCGTAAVPATRTTSVSPAPTGRRGRAGPLGRQRQWPHHLRRGAAARYCARGAGTPGLPVHARRRWRRGGLRMRSAATRPRPWMKEG